MVASPVRPAAAAADSAFVLSASLSIFWDRLSIVGFSASCCALYLFRLIVVASISLRSASCCWIAASLPSLFWTRFFRSSFCCFSLSSVSSTALPSSSCFCLRSSTLVGSSFSSLFTSFRLDWVVLRLSSTSFSDCSNFAVLASSSMVMPLILVDAIAVLPSEFSHIFRRGQLRPFVSVVGLLHEHVEDHPDVKQFQIRHAQTDLGTAQKKESRCQLSFSYCLFFFASSAVAMESTHSCTI